MNKTPLVSVIIPAYNEEPRLPGTLQRVLSFLDTQSFSSQVIVVENASTDRTLEIALEFAQNHPRLTVIHEDRPGKGNAVRQGMLAATGEYRFMCDADLSMPIEELPRFLPPNHPGVDIVIGSREAEGAVRYNEPEYRHFGGRLVNWIIRVLALPGMQDTQCGFKSFTAKVAVDLFSCQQMLGWSFDIELLFVARRRGYKIVEMGIPWYYSAHSHVSPFRDALRMVIDILIIRLNAFRGVYAQKV